MLKVESLEMNKTFCPRDPEVKHGTAKLTLSDGDEASATLTGNFHLENCANGIVACIGLIGNEATPVAGITSTNTELKLSSKVVRKVVLSEAAATAKKVVIKGFAPYMQDFNKAYASGNVCKLLSGNVTAPKVTKVTVAAKPEDSETTVEFSNAEKGVVVIEIPVEVAVGKLKNDLTPADAQHVLEAGECHIDAVVRVADAPNLKSAVTSWTVEGAQLRLAKNSEIDDD